MNLYIIFLILSLGDCRTKEQNNIYEYLKECKQFIKTSPQSTRATFSRLTGKGRYLVKMEAKDGDIDLSSEVTMAGPVIKDNTFISKCMGIEHLLSRSKQPANGSHPHLLTLTMHTDSTVLAGVINVSTACYNIKRDLQACEAVFLPKPELLAIPPLAHTPLKQAFWKAFKDKRPPFQEWIYKLSVKLSVGSIDSTWVSGLQVRSLTNLVINGNNWGQLGPILAPLPKLQLLDLSNNNIERIPAGFFNNTPALTELILSKNNLSHFMDAVTSLRNIKRLELNHMFNSELLNNETNLCTLLSETSIQIISISENEIVIFKDDSICNNQTTLSLKELDLSINNISTLPVHIFSRLRNLSELKLYNNVFKECPKNLTLRSLKNLDFKINSISQLQNYCFSGLPSLKNLDISYNKLSSIEASVFDTLKSLKTLSLSHNKISILSGTFFSHLNSLQMFDLSYNELQIEPILGNIYINELDLSHNRLSYVINITVPMKKIDVLNLSWNNILALNIERVKSLNVSHNNLKSFPESITQNIDNKTLQHLDLGGNYFNCCNSDISHFQQWLQNISITVNNLNSTAPLTCTLSDTGQQIVLRSVVYDELCFQPSNLAVELGIPLAALGALFVIACAILYWRRRDLRYTRHILRMKQQAKETDEKQSSHCKYDAFVCYSAKDFLWVTKELMPKLENGPEGYRLCLHDRDFTIGAAIDSNIVAALEKSRKVIIVISKDFISSRWCQWELQMANHKTFEQNRDFIILVELERLDHRALPSHLRYLMVSRTYLEWPKEEHKVERAWNRLRDALGQSIVQRTGILPDSKNTVLHS